VSAPILRITSVRVKLRANSIAKKRLECYDETLYDAKIYDTKIYSRTIFNGQTLALKIIISIGDNFILFIASTKIYHLKKFTFSIQFSY